MKFGDDSNFLGHAKALCLADSLILHGKVDGSDVRLRRWAARCEMWQRRKQSVYVKMLPSALNPEQFWKLNEVGSIRNIHMVSQDFVNSVLELPPNKILRLFCDLLGMIERTGNQRIGLKIVDAEVGSQEWQIQREGNQEINEQTIAIISSIDCPWQEYKKMQESYLHELNRLSLIMFHHFSQLQTWFVHTCCRYAYM